VKVTTSVRADFCLAWGHHRSERSDNEYEHSRKDTHIKLQHPRLHLLADRHFNTQSQRSAHACALCPWAMPIPRLSARSVARDHISESAAKNTEPPGCSSPPMRTYRKLPPPSATPGDTSKRDTPTLAHCGRSMSYLKSEVNILVSPGRGIMPHICEHAHIYMHINTYMYRHAHTHTRKNKHTRIYVYLFVYIHRCIYIHIYIYIYINLYIYVDSYKGPEIRWQRR